MIEEKSSKSLGYEIEEGTYKRKKVKYIARRVIVSLAPVDDESALSAAMDSVMSKADGARVLRRPKRTGRMVLLIPEGESVQDWVKKLAGEKTVLYAEPDMVDHIQITPNDPRFVDQWALPMVNAEAAWDLETGQSNVLIGVIDSGISMTGGSLDHDDLSTPGRTTLGTDFVDGGTPRDLNGHGTHVAGIAAGAGNNAAGIAGMNWNSPMYICRTLDASGSGSSADFADAVEEITDYAVANGLKAVINYSGGGGHNLTKQDACQYASDNGMLVVAATGNDYAGPVIWPAAYSTSITGVVAVGSTDSDDTVSGFSNVGPEVTVVAPGGSILSATPTYTVKDWLAVNYDYMNGTSMATPLVTGLAALMWSRHPSFTNQKIKTCLQDTAVKLGSGNFNNNWGYGRVDALAALKCGDISIPITRIGPTCHLVTRISHCDPITRIISDCFPRTAICPITRIGACTSRLPVLCPNTRISGCWSRLLCIEPTTRVGCQINTRICPSAVDGCPSTPGGCGGFPFDPRVIRRFGELEMDVDALTHEMWYGSEDDSESDDEPGWFYVDDDGTVHEF
jgi:subtilisin family serine protease